MVAAREVLYLATTLACVAACPVYVLLGVSSVWAEAKSKDQGCWRLVINILTPHNYVALCLVVQFSGRGAAPPPCLQPSKVTGTLQLSLPICSD